jgi:hypothetical protein
MSIPAQKPVFVSHSQHDAEGQLFLHNVFNQPTSKFRPLFYSVEGPKPPHAESIRSQIRSSVALFVLLSSPMTKSDYTRSWIGFEVGIAAERNLPVVVIEPDVNPAVNLPVPGTTHYIRRPKTAASIGVPLWRTVAETACQPQEREELPYTGKLGPDILAGLANMFMDGVDGTGEFHRTTCHNDGCRSSFWVPMSLYTYGRFPCPVCRNDTASLVAQLTEMALEAEKNKTPK